MKFDLTVPAISKETKVNAVEDDIKSKSSRNQKLSLEPAFHDESISRQESQENLEPARRRRRMKEKRREERKKWEGDQWGSEYKGRT